MARTLLVVPTAAGAGLARTCLGVVRALDRRGVKVAFFKPVVQPRADGGPDRSTALVAATTGLRPPDPLSTSQLEQQLGAGGLDVVLEKIVAAWQPVHSRSDVVVVEGLSPGLTKLYASGLNQALAKALDADVLLVGSWPAADTASGRGKAGRTAEPGPDPAAGTVGALAETLAITARGYWSGEHARVIGCVVNGLPAEDPSSATRLGNARARRGLRRIAGVPHRPELTWLRVRDLVRELGPRVLNEGDLSGASRTWRCSPRVSLVASACSPRAVWWCPRGPPRSHHGCLPRRAQRNPAGRPAPFRGDGAGPANMGAHTGCLHHRPAYPCRRRQQLRDRDPGA